MNSSKTKKILWAAAVGLGLGLAATVVLSKSEPLQSFRFQEDNALTEWKEKIFRGKVYYTIERLNDEGFVQAQSEGSASGYYYRIKFDVRERPMVSWRWKVDRFPVAALADDKPAKGQFDTEDYAARLYLIFPANTIAGSRCLEYVWHETLPAGTILTSPLTETIKLIVARSGPSSDWVTEERDVREDYTKAFGQPPTLAVGAIAFMTDTDNTASTAEALYDEFKIGYEKER